jgi:hypothetical protein
MAPPGTSEEARRFTAAPTIPHTKVAVNPKVDVTAVPCTYAQETWSGRSMARKAFPSGSLLLMDLEV